MIEVAMEVVFTMAADSHVLTVGWPQADGALSARRRWILDDATVVLIYHPLSHVIDRLLPEDDEGSVGICHGITRGITHFRAFTGPAFSWSLGIDRQRKSFLSPLANLAAIGGSNSADRVWIRPTDSHRAVAAW